MAMGNSRRRHIHKKKKEKRRRAIALAAKDAMRGVTVLRSLDGVELAVPNAEACRYGAKVEEEIRFHHAYYGQTAGSSCNRNGCSTIHLAVQSSILFKVIHYSNKQTHNPDWDDSEFVANLDHATLFGLVLAAESLRNQRLLDITCRTVTDMIHGKSPTQIRAMFGIRPPPPPTHGRTTKKLTTSDQKPTTTLELEERALRALHAVRCHKYTVYDPKRHCFLYTRLLRFNNYAFFDHDKECELRRGPALHEIHPPLCESVVFSGVNFISLKVCESDVGFPINVFGTVIARDEVDYKCVYLFRREADDCQTITSPVRTYQIISPSQPYSICP
jgi:hypothetical protein